MSRRTGEQNINRQGERMAICDYRSVDDIDIIWKSDNSVQTTYYDAFKDGTVIKNNSIVAPSEWLNTNFLDKDGFEAEIIEFISDDNITVKYYDGDIVTGLNLNDIVNRKFGKQKSISPIEYLLFSKKKREKNISNERESTYKNVRYLLERFRRCLIIRPCSFGKTFIAMRLFLSPRYQRCLFLHPLKDELNVTKIEKIFKAKHTDKVIDTNTYAWLRGLTDTEIKCLNYDIVFMDEVHGAAGDDKHGAIKTFEAVRKLMASHPGTHFAGATATPVRMDGLDVADIIFNNHLCYPYTDEDAFEDGLLKKPYYRYCIRDVVKKIRNEVGKIVKDEHLLMDREKMMKTLGLSDNEVDEVDSRFMDRHIKECCDKVVPDTSYMRFIVYYLDNESISKNNKKVETWFKKAYPEHEIASIVVTSRSSNDLRDVDNLPVKPSGPQYKGRIDLIFNCEMLCMGYHSEYITGLVIDRSTKSLSKYLQMTGRILSCDNDNPVLIFDVVDNIHAEFIIKNESQYTDCPLQSPVKLNVLTYDDVVQFNPQAKDWSEIRKNNLKAEKADKIARVCNSPKNPVFVRETDKGRGDEDTREELQIPEVTVTEEEEKKFREKLDMVFGEIHDKKPSWADAVKKIAGIEEEFSNLTDRHTETDNSTGSFYHKFSETNDIPRDKKTELGNKQTTVISSPVTGVREKTEIEQSLGYYEGGCYYDFDTGNLYSKNVNLLCKSIDYEKKIKELQRELVIKDIEHVIEKWHSLDKTCENNYRTYEEIDRKSPKYKLLTSCAKIYGNEPVEVVLRYMIEGAA